MTQDRLTGFPASTAVTPCANSRLGATHHTRTVFGSARFRNPWNSTKSLKLADVSAAIRLGADVDPQAKSSPALAVCKPDFKALSRREGGMMFVGHASVLLQLPWSRHRSADTHIGVLFDPVFSIRCSPSQYIGPRRFVAVPLTVAQLPPIHICCISHDHYDHLDRNTVKELLLHHRHTIKFFVPLGVKKWFADLVHENFDLTVFELDWGQEVLVKLSESIGDASASSSKAFGETLEPTLPDDLTVHIKVACTAAQHRSGRGITDQWKTLWCSWVVATMTSRDMLQVTENWLEPGLHKTDFRCFFGGDTGLQYAGGTSRQSVECPAFQDISDLYGPFDLALLPISTGSSLSFIRKVFGLSLNQHALTSSVHCSIRDAIRLHEILNSKQSLGIHWGTFCPADEAHGTLRALERCRSDAGLPAEWALPGAFTVQDVGKVLSLQ